VCSLDEGKASQSDQELMESEQADRSLFVQELLLAVHCDHGKPSEVASDSAVDDTAAVKVAAAAPQTKSDSSAAPHRAATASSVNVDRVPAAAAGVPRAPRIPAAGSVPPMDGNRVVSAPSSTSRPAVVKRKPIPTAARTGKDSTPAAPAGNKRH